MFIKKLFKECFIQPKHSVKLFSSASAMENSIVTVKQGKVKGSVQSLLDGTPYYSFKGIPYAQPPVGKLRFKGPVSTFSWDGIRDATEHGPVCPQYDINTTQLLEGSEDCLYLNVYTKSLKPNANTPVMVYIHGGAFMSGSSNTDTYGPEYFLQNDVILVTINYRLEALGFLCLDIPEAPGNAGIKDQVAAMRWVKENITRFGGDSNNITVFGESAGAGSVTYHILSPMSQGLFNKAIAQSGVALQDWCLEENPRDRAFRLGKALGKDTKDVKELLDFLLSVPAVDLANITRVSRTEDEKYRDLPIHYTPVIEKPFAGVESFITKRPTDALLEGNFNKVPLLTGFNTLEGILMVPDSLKKKDVLNAKPSFFVPREIARKVSEEKMNEFGDRLKKFYFGDKGVCKENVRGVIDLQSDKHFIYQTHRFAGLYQKYAPVYMYKFDHDTDLNIVKAIAGFKKMKGACHADDVFYFFCNEVNKDTYKEQENVQKIVNRLTKYWTDFAKTGNPTPGDAEVKWQPYTVTDRQYMVLGEPIEFVNCQENPRIDLWNKMYGDAGLPYITKSAI